MTLVDVARGLTIVWVVTFHFYVDTRGVPAADATAAAAAAALSSGDLLELAAVAARSMIGLPGYRLDVLLFVTGLVLCLARPVGARTFLARRARSILPNYWFGSLAAATLLLLLAAVRTMVTGTPFTDELREGARLGGQPYLFEPFDILRSLSIVGRFETPRTMQVVAPSMWYLLLMAQFYLMFPLLRWVLQRIGPLGFLAACVAGATGARALVFAHAPFGAFSANATLLYALPCRLLPPALGMVAAGLLTHALVQKRMGLMALASAPAFLLALVAGWLGSHANEPGTTLGLIGPVLPMLLALPGLWVACVTLSATPVLAPLLKWSGQKALPLLVVQDFLRFGVGTLIACGVGLQELTWALLPVYVAAALMLTQVWDPVPAWCASRFWPVLRADPRRVASPDTV